MHRIESFPRLEAIRIDTFNPSDLHRAQAAHGLEYYRRKLSHNIEDYAYSVNAQGDLLKSYPSETLPWWQEHGPTFPYLPTMARIFLGIQATSVLSERLFSAAGNMLTDKKANMSNSVFEMSLLI
ncbi:hypothetical protein BGZ99_001947 [Dissophora globulifera]|uniref:HAT C-terminal dimerisation domain-containing protein n=1 Tax=Dissophora globulifera TaxID=979702 RepID=A0A9P6RSE7_9FUNG|nr:hypothetical protein BGZ99_001947 [Dissophora globulifera]